MEVILRQAVDNLGHPGDVVTVSAGYARNYLLPRGVAFAATEGNKKRIAQEKARLEAAESQRRASAEDVAKRLEEVSITFSAPSKHRYNPPTISRGVMAQGRNWLRRSAPGSRMSSLLRRLPLVMDQMIGSSRSGVNSVT